MFKRAGITTTDFIFGHILGSDLTLIKSQFLSDLSSVADGQSAEILTHPGYFDQEILQLSSLNYERARDLDMCLDPQFKQSILDLGFQIVNYTQI